MTFQCAKVNQALGSYAQMVKTGNRVVFEQQGRYIQNIPCGSKLLLKDEDGVYVLPMKVGPRLNRYISKQGLGRQGP